jgi:hypothetical protein
VFSAYYSTESASGPWTELTDAQTIEMENPVYAGIFVTSHNNIEACTAKFTDLDFGTFTPTDVSTFKQTSLNVYPNPLKEGHVTIFLESKERNKVDIINATGQIMFSKSIEGEEHVCINRDAFQKSGIYFIKVTSIHHQCCCKLLVL